MALDQFGKNSSEIISISQFWTHFVNMREINFINKMNRKVNKTWNGIRGIFLQCCKNLATCILQTHIFARSKIIGNHKSTAPPGATTQKTWKIPIPQDPIFYVFHRRLQCDTEHRKTSTQMAIKNTSVFWFLHRVHSKSSHNYRTPVTLLAWNANHSDIAKSRLNHGLAETYCFSVWNC